MISFLKQLNKITTAINLLAQYICGALFFAMFFCTSAQVICRFVFKISTPWAEEWARFLFIWIVLLGSSCASKLVKHINIDAIVNLLEGKMLIAIKAMSSLALIAFYAICVKSGWSYTMRGIVQVSAVTITNMALIYVSVPISFGLMLIYEIEILLQTIFGYHPDMDDTIEIGGSE